MQVQATTTIDRPVAVVWQFYAVDHVTNHPRWDESVELRATSHDAIGVGTIMERRVSRFGKVTEGTMEVTEFEPETVMSVRTQDGPMAIDGFARFRPVGDGQTEITIGGEIPGIDDAVAEQIRGMMNRSVTNIKALIESET
jgi:hypothetical protein